MKIHAEVRDGDLELLAAHDSDPFNRWQAVQTLATAILTANVAAQHAGTPARSGGALIRALHTILSEPGLEPAFVAQVMALPSENDIAREIGRDVHRTRSSRRGAHCVPKWAATLRHRSPRPMPG